jgi:hypothetical protein
VRESRSLGSVRGVPGNRHSYRDTPQPGLEIRSVHCLSPCLKNRNHFKLDEKIAKMKADLAAGRPVRAFPPVRAGYRETFPGGSDYSHADGPNLAKLAQHRMKNVLQPMEKAVKEDRKTLATFLKHCGGHS